MGNLEHMDWGCRKDKRRARQNLLDRLKESQKKLSPGEALFPKGSQFWTIAGSFGDGKGGRSQQLEPEVFVAEGVLSPDQYRGVDICPKVCDLNRRVAPEYQTFQGDFYDIMDEHYRAGTYKPRVVHVDTTFQSKKAIELFMRCYKLALMASEEPVWVAVTLVLRLNSDEHSKVEEAFNQVYRKVQDHRIYQGAFMAKRFGNLSLVHYYRNPDQHRYLMCTLMVSPK